MESSARHEKVIVAALANSFSHYGIDLLARPQQLVATLMDQLPKSPEMPGFRAACEEGLLEPFAERLSGNGSPRAADIREAAMEAKRRLQATGDLTDADAEYLCGLAVQGIKEYLGLDVDRSNYRFLGWATLSNSTPGGEHETIEIGGPTTIFPVWGAKVSFDANGGGGYTSDVYAGANGKATLPSCGFTYAGHVFDGWAISRTGGSPHNPGESVYALRPKTYCATWKLNPNITDKLTTETSGIDWGDGTCTFMLRVTNRSNSPLKLTGHFTFRDAYGRKIETKATTKQAVAPGETTSLDRYCNHPHCSGWHDTTYRITARDVEISRLPLFGTVTISEHSISSEEVVLHLENNSNKRAYIESVTFFAFGSEEQASSQHEYPRMFLENHEGVYITFTTSWDAGSKGWDSMSREYYLDGYIEQD